MGLRDPRGTAILEPNEISRTTPSAESGSARQTARIGSQLSGRTGRPFPIGALDKAGVAKRYNLGTYESMGIGAEPLKHVNSRTFNKERKGELTEDGPVLARRQWDNVHDRLVKQNEEHARARQARIERLADHASRLVRTQPNADHRTKDVQKLKELGIKASLPIGFAGATAGI